MKLSNLLFFLVIGSFFACNQDSELLLDTKEQLELEQRRDDRPCNPNVNFPISFDDMSSEGQVIDPLLSLDTGELCDLDNFTANGNSPLENYYDCVFDNEPYATTELECETVVIELYKYCKNVDFTNQGFDIFLFPANSGMNPNDPNTITAWEDAITGPAIFTQADFNIITNYANSIISGNTGGADYVEIDFFITPNECGASGPCAKSIYIEITTCKITGGPTIGVVGG